VRGWVLRRTVRVQGDERLAEAVGAHYRAAGRLGYRAADPARDQL